MIFQPKVMLPAHPSEICFAFHQTGSAGHPGNFFVIFLLCRFIPACKAGLSRHLPVRLMVCLASCMYLLLSTVPDGYASRGVISIQPETVQIVLRMAGLETEIVDLAREDGFDRALYADNLGSDPLLIGFPGTGIGKGFPFLLAVEGEEIVFLIAKDGGLEVVSGNEAVIPAGVIDAVQCLVSTLLGLIQGILDASLNPFSIIALVLNAVFSILGCVFSLVF